MISSGPMAWNSTYALITLKFYPQTTLLILTLKPPTLLFCFVFCISMKSYSILPIAQSKNFTVILIYSLSLSHHIYSISNFCWLCLQNICRIQPLLTTSATIPVQAITSCSDNDCISDWFLCFFPLPHYSLFFTKQPEWSFVNGNLVMSCA